MSTKIMENNLDILDKVNSKYSEEENLLEERLQKIERLESNMEKDNTKPTPSDVLFENDERFTFKTLKELKQRNAQWIKEMEISRARLRSRLLYSPTETVLHTAIKDYVESISNK